MARNTEELDADWSAYVLQIATRLRQARLNAKLSQEQTAYKAGITRYTYQKYEKGESRPGRAANPSLRVMLALSQVFDQPLESLIPEHVPDLRIR